MKKILKISTKQIFVECKTMMVLVLIGILLCLVENNYVKLAGGIGIIILLLIIFYRSVAMKTVTWVINDDTICRRKGVWVIKTDYVELYRVVDYMERQSFIQRLLSIKTITIISRDVTDPIMEIKGISYDDDVIKIIRDNVEKCKIKKHVYEISNY